MRFRFFAHKPRLPASPSAAFLWPSRRFAIRVPVDDLALARLAKMIEQRKD